MTIIGLDNAIEIAKDRAIRSRDNICIVQVGVDEYVLWREVNINTLPLVYTYYKIVKKIRI